MLMSPPAPPKPSMTNENATASIIGLSQGSAVTQPNAPLPPRSRPAISTEAQIVNTVSSVGSATSAGEHRMHELEAGADLRIGEQVVDADRHRDHEEQDEGDPRHRVAVEPPADRARDDRVVGDVGRHQPEIDDGVQRPREEHARQPGVDRVVEAERHRQDLEQHLERGADRGPAPRDRRRRRWRTSPAAPACRDCRASRPRRLIDISATQIHEPTTTSTTPM